MILKTLGLKILYNLFTLVTQQLPILLSHLFNDLMT